jgi:hypothetical protein
VNLATRLQVMQRCNGLVACLQLKHLLGALRVNELAENFTPRLTYCDVFGRMPSLGNLKLDTPVVVRQPKVKHFHGYAHHSVLSRCMVA